MNELEQAQKNITNKNFSFEQLHKQTGVAVSTLKAYRKNPEKLETAKWIAVHKLAALTSDGATLNDDYLLKTFYEKIVDDECVEVPDGSESKAKLKLMLSDISDAIEEYYNDAPLDQLIALNLINASDRDCWYYAGAVQTYKMDDNFSDFMAVTVDYHSPVSIVENYQIARTINLLMNYFEDLHLNEK